MNQNKRQAAIRNLIEADANLRKAVRRLRRIRAARASSYRATVRDLYARAER